MLPRYDVLVREDGIRSANGRIVHCNFLQMVENSVDQHHFNDLPHAETLTDNEVLTPEVTEYGILDTFTRTVGGESIAP